MHSHSLLLLKSSVSTATLMSAFSNRILCVQVIHEIETNASTDNSGALSHSR
jgi:hypothetical protein